MDIAGGKPSSLDVVVRFLVVRFPCRTGLFGGMALAGGKPSLLDVVRFLVVLPCRTVQARTRLLLNSSTMRNIVTINFSTSARLRPPAPHPRFHFELLRWTTYEILSLLRYQVIIIFRQILSRFFGHHNSANNRSFVLRRRRSTSLQYLTSPDPEPYCDRALINASFLRFQYDDILIF